MRKIYCPSFEVEKRTKAFNRYIWWFVALISLFTVGGGIFAAFHTFMSSFLELVSSPITDHMGVPICVLVCALVVLALQHSQVNRHIF